VHVNHLAPGDADLLGRAGASVVHCPRSHAYFRHAAFPRRELQAAGVNVCLGTDSLASMKREGRAAPQLDLWAEMRAWLAADANLCPPVVLRLATVNGARALGRAGELGELSPGAAADVIAVPCAGGGDVAEALIGQGGPVSAVMIGGQWATVPGGGPVR
jgi:cytosine/adenosine deaminase-related metal-dependent hydrolase